MRKILCCTLSICLLFLGCEIHVGKTFKESGRYTFYLLSPSSQCLIKSMDGEEANSFICLTSSLKGESLHLDNPKDLDGILTELNAQFLFSESAEDTLSNYYFSPKIKNHIIIKGQKVNLHTAQSKNYAVIGTPIIFGSF